MVYTGVVPIRHPESRIVVHVFTRGIRAMWISLPIVTIVLETIPIPPILPVPLFYAYCAVKAILFVLLGYVAPLAFWRFNVLNRGLAFAAASSCCVETLQAVVGHGHSFHWYEMLIKLVLIVLGFAFGLDARYDREISLGPVRIPLVGEHL